MVEEKEEVLSVYELAQGLKRTVEDATSGRWVEGEVGRLSRPGSGHLYFSLKDETRDALIDCVMYKRDVLRFGGKIREGGRVQLRGRATFYPPRGRLQWIAEIARQAGQGSLLEALARLKERLIDEGLMAMDRKQQLPRDPRVIGVVTSGTGAAFSDIVTVARRRGSVRILLAPAIVQGDEAPDSIIRAIDLLERAAPDVMIVGRGGGSAEDLMAFNDERVVRRLADCVIPTVSAVGHEVDTSLSDLVADARAATPSQAAELVVPDDENRRMVLLRLQGHMARTMQSIVTQKQLSLESIQRKIADPRFVLADAQQQLDDLRIRLERRSSASIMRNRGKLEEKNRRLYARHPQIVLSTARAKLGPLDARLKLVARRVLDKKGAELSQSARALSALSPLAVLGRGYALALHDGKPVRRADLLHPGDSIQVRVEKGSFSAKVSSTLSSAPDELGFPGGERGEV